MIAGIIAGGVADTPAKAASYYSAEALGPTNVPASTGGATFHTSASLTVLASQQTANATYLGLWSTDLETADTIAATSRLNKNSGTILQTEVITAKGSSLPARSTEGGIFFHVAGVSPATVSYAIEHSKGSGVGTATASNSRIALLKLGANDVYVEDVAGPGAISSTAMATIASLSLPGTGRDWLILASLNVAQGNALVRFELTDGTTTTGDIQISTKRATSETLIPIQTALYLPGITSGTVNLRVRTGSASFPVTASNIRLVALRLDRFAHATVAKLGSNNAGTGVTWTTAHSQIFTPAAADYLVLGAGAFSANSNSIPIKGRFVDDGAEINQFAREATSPGDAYPFFSHRIVAMPASSRTQSLDRQSYTSGVTATLNAQAFVASLDLTGI